MIENLDKYEEKMMGVIDNLEANFATIRTGRASASLLDRVRVDYYGEPTPINQMSKITVLEGTQLVIKPYDRTAVKDIAKAINAANLGINPQAEADCIRIVVPQLTEERRKQFAKEVQKYGEEAKVALRNVRREANDAIKKDKEIPEDVEKSLLDDSQKLTDRYVKEVEKLTADKKADVMNV